MSEERKRSWLKISCIGCVGMPFLVVLLTYGVVKCQVSRIGDRLPQELAKLRSMGVPLEPAELRPNPSIPPGQNAADFLNPLIADFKKIKEEEFYKEGNRRISDLQSKRIRVADDPSTRAMVLRLEPFLQRADGIAGKSRLYFERDWTKGISVMFPEYAYLKEIAKLQSYRSAIACLAGDYRKSLTALRCIFALSRLLGQEPTLIGALVAIAVHSIGYAALETHLERFQSEQAALVETRAMLEAIPGIFDLRRSTNGEIVMIRQWLHSINSGEALGHRDEYGADEDTLLAVALRDPQVREMYEVRYLQLWAKAFAAMPEDPTDWRGFGKAMEIIDREVEKTPTADTYLNQIIFPVMVQFPVAAGQMQAQHRLALLAIRLLQDRATGLPPDLRKYGVLAVDPMDGLPMRYVRKDNGFKIWSIGKDLVDNGGAKFWRNVGMSNQNTDEVLMFFYPESPPIPLKRP